MVNSCNYHITSNWIFSSLCWLLCIISIYLQFILMNKNTNPYLTIVTIIFGLLFINYFIDSKYIYYICIMISLGSIVSYKIAKFIENVWLKFSFILSKIVPNILLTTIFIFLLTPLAILSRIFKAKTNFISSNTKNTAEIFF